MKKKIRRQKVKLGTAIPLRALRTLLACKGGTFIFTLVVKCSFEWRWNLDTAKSWSEIPGEFRNVMLKKDGDRFDRQYEELKSATQSEGGNKNPKYNKKKED